MSSVLTRNRGEQGESTDAREQAVRAIKTAMERADSDGSGGKLARTYLVIDLGAAIGSIMGGRSGSSEVVEEVAERGLETATGGESGRTMTSERSGRSKSARDDEGGGRSTLTTLFLLGAVVGIGYAVRRRMGSMDEITSKATDRAQSAADRAAMQSGEAAGRTETVADEAAERIEESGEMAADRVETGSEEMADRVREGGEGAADQMEGAGETVEEMEDEAEERAEEMTEEGSDSDEESEE